MIMDMTDYLRLGVFLGSRYPKLMQVASFKIVIIPPEHAHRMYIQRMEGSVLTDPEVEFKNDVLDLYKVGIGKDDAAIWVGYDEVENVVVLQEER